MLAAAYNTPVPMWWDVPLVTVLAYFADAQKVMKMTNPFFASDDEAEGGDRKRKEMTPDQFIAAARAMGVMS